MKKRFFGVVGLMMLIALSLAPFAFGQGSATVVKAQGYTDKQGVIPKSKFRIAIKLDVGEGYHINAHFPSEEFLVAMNVKFEPLAGVKISEVKYPKPKLQK